jgi:hypothetical protein
MHSPKSTISRYPAAPDNLSMDKAKERLEKVVGLQVEKV